VVATGPGWCTGPMTAETTTEHRRDTVEPEAGSTPRPRPRAAESTVRHRVLQVELELSHPGG
jgi:hypothetical protein